jgi:hypothetical protein
MKRLIFALGLFASAITFPSAPTPHVSQAVGLDADVKSALAEARSSSGSRAIDQDPADLKTGAAHAAASTAPVQVNQRLSSNRQQVYDQWRKYTIKQFAWQCTSEAQIRLLKEFIKEGFINIDQKDSVGFQDTLLHYSVKYNKALLRNFLIHNGANLNSQNSDGETPLYYAVFQYRNLDAAIDLIKAGADIDLKHPLNKKNTLHFLFHHHLTFANSPMAISLIEITTHDTQDLISDDEKIDPLFAKSCQSIEIGLQYRAQYQSNLAQQMILIENAIGIKPLAALIHRLVGRQIFSLEHVRPPLKIVTQPTPNKKNGIYRL